MAGGRLDCGGVAGIVERVEEVDDALRLLVLRALRGWAVWEGLERRGWRGSKSTAGARDGGCWVFMLPLPFGRWG